jgi:hypothetical protein
LNWTHCTGIHVQPERDSTNTVRTTGRTELSHHRIIFHVNPIASRGTGSPATTVIALTVPTSVCHPCIELFGNPITSSGDDDYFVGIFSVEIVPIRVRVVIERNEIRSIRSGKEKRKKKRGINLCFYAQNRSLTVERMTRAVFQAQQTNQGESNRFSVHIRSYLHLDYN